MTDEELVTAQGVAIEDGDIELAQDIEDYFNRED